MFFSSLLLASLSACFTSLVLPFHYMNYFHVFSICSRSCCLPLFPFPRILPFNSSAIPFPLLFVSSHSTVAYFPQSSCATKCSHNHALLCVPTCFTALLQVLIWNHLFYGVFFLFFSRCFLLRFETSTILQSTFRVSTQQHFGTIYLYRLSDLCLHNTVSNTTMFLHNVILAPFACKRAIQTTKLLHVWCKTCFHAARLLNRKDAESKATQRFGEARRQGSWKNSSP